jgi:hypothetical protein
MSLFRGEEFGLKIIESFNVFIVTNKPMKDSNGVDGFVDIDYTSAKSPFKETKKIRELFMVETVLPSDVLALFDEEKLANTIADKIKIALLGIYQGLIIPDIIAVGIATGYDDSFRSYSIKK